MLFRKSSFDVDAGIGTIVAIGMGAIMLVLVWLVVSIVLGLQIFADEGVNTSPIQANIGDMINNFFELMPYVGTLMAIVVFIGAVVILILYLKKMRTNNSDAMQG